MRVVKRPQDQCYWVVRAQSGRYVPNFKVGKQIAISHLDHLKLPNSPVFYPDKDELLTKMLRQTGDNKKSTKARIKNHYNQAIRFIYEIKIGDLVVCPTSRYIMVGRVVGKPYISDKVVEVITDEDTGEGIRMASNLRRSVVWGPNVNRNDLPYIINRALRANMAIFSLNDYWELLYHTLYPCFLNSNNFHFTIKIGQKENIDNYSVSHLLGYLSEAEAAATLFDKIDISNPPEFHKEFLSLRLHNELHLQSKAQFMSPGEYLGNLPIGDLVEGAKVTSNMLWFYLFYSGIFGSRLIGWEGIIDADTKKKIFSFIKEKWTDRGGETTKKALGLGEPKYKTELLEDHSQDEERQRQIIEFIDLEKVFNENQHDTQSQ